MLDFPNSPTIGQTFNSGSGAIYVWDGVAWSIATSQTATAERRNRITNSAMNVSQENGTAQIAAAASGSYFAADQWVCLWTTATGSLRAGSGINGPDGFYHCYLNIVTAQASLSAGHFGFIRQNLEGLDIADLLWGTAAAKQVVLRFSIMVPVSGTYCVRIANGDTTRSYVAAFSVPTANVWQDVVLVIPGDTTGTWLTDSSRALYLDFCCGTGSTFVGVAGWQAGNFYATAAQVNGIGTVGVFRIANVGLYADPNRTGLPPAIQTPDYATELAKCMRYYASQYLLLGGYHVAAGVLYGTLFYKVPMRANPSLSYGSPAYSNCSALISAGQILPVNNGVQITVTATGTASCGATAIANARM